MLNTFTSHSPQRPMVRNYVVDSDEDRATIDTYQILPGSTVFVINDKKKYTFNHSNEWIETTSSGKSIQVESLTINENGIYTAEADKAYTPVTVNVPNSYAAEDEGKVVSNGALVEQTAHAEVTQNGTIDTTLNNSVTVNVGGGGSVASNDVNFIDYDGTIVASYSATDFAQLSALPANPSHSGLTAQGWNWSLVNAKSYVANYGSLNIGQMYITDDGKTRIYVHFEEGRTSPYFGLAVNGTVDIDWGDGSEHGTLTGSSLTTIVTVQHIFQPGDYVIKVTPASGTSFTLAGETAFGSRVLYKTSGTGTGSSYSNRVYQSAIQKVELGSGVTSIGDNAFQSCNGLTLFKFVPTVPPTIANSNAFSNLSTDCIIYIPYTGLASYLSATNYPAKATYTYLGFATYVSSATLPTQDSTSAYNVTWYATKEDAIAGTNPITQGNGSEVYCTYAAV